MHPCALSSDCISMQCSSSVPQKHLTMDVTLLHISKQPYLSPHSPHAQRILLDSSGRRLASLGPDEYCRLAQRDSWLDDTCINDLAVIIQHQLTNDPIYSSSARRIAMFSTFTLLLPRHGPVQLWKQTRHLRFWERDIWLLPIHRQAANHWVLAVVVPARGSVLLFDSFGDT